ncbi:chromate resistance protein ChrB domain-containing protein [Aquabacterium humicola]|uniref:chromate resistance protein ChrB domain-containing protein n=1 Tax=Aquabacterium humicola TaxID=3237377 RepID=UPI00254298E8|nr:chromate resistance protein ChrB domain-containing protein [Rubrivivax pictus]
MWAVLFLTLPTQPNAVRLRVWRGLKAVGSAALRDGAYLLPQAQAALFEPLADEVREHGGSATLMDLAPRGETQRIEIEALFSRRDAYAQWRSEADQFAAQLETLDETDARRRLRTCADALAALQRIDYYPGAAGEQAEAHLAALRRALDGRFSKGEPLAQAAQGLVRLDVRKHQGRRWATRARPWVDRLACAWLIRRFIDAEPTFVWLDDPARAPRGVLGFDYDGARFTHVGALVSFEVLAASFGLDGDAKLQRIAQAVHYLDVGGIPVPEAPGLEAVLAGLRAVHADDDQLAAAAGAVFDALYAAPGASTMPNP